MSFKCKICKKQSKNGETQFKKVYKRRYFTDEEPPKMAEQIAKEDLVCCNCWKKENRTEKLR